MKMKASDHVSYYLLGIRSRAYQCLFNWKNRTSM